MPFVQAVDVTDLVNAFAVNTHMQQGWQYGDAAKTVSVLKDLGVVQVRDAFTGLGVPGLEFAAKAGIKFCFLISPNWKIPDLIKKLEAWEAKYPGSIIGIEGPNEVNNWPVTYEGMTGIPGAQAFQRALYGAVKASPMLSTIPVIGLTSWPFFQNDSDFGNVHAYDRSGNFLTEAIKVNLSYETTANPNKPIWMTEAGYHTHLGADYHEGVSESVQAKMVTSLFLEAFELGITKSFVYQLANQYNDGTEQSFYGLVDQQWKEKPAFGALKNMIAIMRAGDQGATGPVGSLGYELSGLPLTAHQKLFQADNGDWTLAVWNEPVIWNAAIDTEIENAESQVVLRLAEPAAQIALHDPLEGVSAVETAQEAAEFSFTLDDHPVFIKIR